MTAASWRDKYLARGLQRTGIVAGQAGFFFDDFCDLSQWSWVAGGVRPEALTTAVGGVIDINGDTGTMTHYRAFAPVIHETLPFYVAGRAAFPAIPTQTPYGAAFGVGSPAIAPYIGMGVNPAGSTTKYGAGMVMSGTVSVLSTIDIDTGFHDFEMWKGTGAGWYFAVDNETPVVGTDPTPTADILAPFFVLIAAGGIDTTRMQLDKYLCLFPQGV
jgi:hypothetical protein